MLFLGDDVMPLGIAAFYFLMMTSSLFQWQCLHPSTLAQNSHSSTTVNGSHYIHSYIPDLKARKFFPFLADENGTFRNDMAVTSSLLSSSVFRCQSFPLLRAFLEFFILSESFHWVCVDGRPFRKETFTCSVEN